MKKFGSLTAIRYPLNARSGYSLIELLIFSVIFSIAMVAFITIFVAITRVQVRQNAAAEVNQQSQFLLQTIQSYVERSSLIDMTADAATSSLKLRMTASSQDPTYIYLSGGVVYLKQTDAGSAQALSSSKVTIGSLTFTKRSNPPGHDSVAVAFVVSYTTSNIEQQFSQTLNISIARVSAATFDSDVVPSSTNVYNLGTASNAWTTVNGAIKFNGSNVGIGVVPNTAKFQVTGGDIYLDTNSKGLVLRDSTGVCWKMTVTTGGSLTTASTTCP